MTQPSAAEAARRRFVEFTAETIRNTSSTDYPGVYPGEDHSWNVNTFKESFSIEFHDSQPLDLQFSLIGIDASIANAFRRILIAEVPTVAIEMVYIMNNTSVIQDEVLAQRLGLIPWRLKKPLLDHLNWMDTAMSQPMDYNTVLLELDIECDWAEKGKERFMKGEKDPKKLYKNSNVYAKDFKFSPITKQAKWSSPDDPAVTPVNPDILIAKMRPGQKMKLKAYCSKGIGADHIKYSPVATASYRLMPTIQIIQPIIGSEAKKFARCFPRGVIELEDVTADMAEQDKTFEGKEGEVYAVVKDAMKDPVTRECLRHPEFNGKVRLGRIQDHFIFRIESTGQFDSNELFVEAAKILKFKCMRAKKALAQLNS